MSNKKVIIKEVWLVDKDGNKIQELTPLNIDEIPSMVDHKIISSGEGNIKTNK